MTSTRAWFLGLLVGTAVLAYLLAPVLTPFLLSALLAYVLNPLVACLTAWRVPRVLAVVIVFVVFVAAVLALLLVIVPLLQRQTAAFVTKLPGYLDLLQYQVLPALQASLGVELQLDIAAVKRTLLAHWQEVGDWLGVALEYMTRSGLGLIAWFLNLVLIPLLTFYLLIDWDDILRRALGLFPGQLRSGVAALARETDAVLASFLRGQLSVMLALAAIYSIGLWIMGVDFALPIGVLAGLVSFVPYLGFIVGVVAAGLAAYLQFHDPWVLLGVFAVFGVGQILESFWLTPRLVGDRIGLHPVAVIFAVMAGGQLFGFFGVLLALPAAAALKVWLRHAHERYSGERRPRRKKAARVARRGVSS